MSRLFLGLLFFLAACSSAPTLSIETLPSPVVTVIHTTKTVAPTFTPSATPTATPLPHPMYPYTIAGLREREYKGGEISLDVRIGLTDEFSTYLISYPSDGLRITGVLNIPVGQGPFPVIVMNHGFYPRGEYSSGDGSQRAAEYLAQHGYITISSDYRTWGGSDFGVSFFHTGLVIDVINLIASLDSIPQADTFNIGMWGHSMGGGITTKLLAVQGGRTHILNREGQYGVSAAVLYAPNSADDADLIERWGYGCIGDIAAGELLDTCNSADVIPDSLPAEIIAAYVESAQSPERMREIAPYYHLDSITVPVQIHIGSADGDYIGSTPPEWSYKLNQGLVDAGRDVEMFVYDGQRHSFTGDAWFLFMDRAIAFFDENLK